MIENRFPDRRRDQRAGTIEQAHEVLTLPHLFARSDKNFPNLPVDRRRQQRIGQLGISRGFGIERRAQSDKPLITGTELRLGFSDANRQLVAMLERAWAIIIGIADIFTPPGGFEFDLGGKQPMIERFLGMDGDLGVALGPFYSNRRLVSGNSQRLGPRQCRVGLGPGDLGGGNLRLQIQHALLELSNAAGLKCASLLGDLFVNFLKPRETLDNRRALALDLIDHSLQIIEPTPVGSAVGNMQQESAPRRRGANRRHKVLDPAVDGCPQRDQTGVKDCLCARQLEQALQRPHSGDDDDQ